MRFHRQHCRLIGAIFAISLAGVISPRSRADAARTEVSFPATAVTEIHVDLEEGMAFFKADEKRYVWSPPFGELHQRVSAVLRFREQIERCSEVHIWFRNKGVAGGGARYLWSSRKRESYRVIGGMVLSFVRSPEKK